MHVTAAGIITVICTALWSGQTLQDANADCGKQSVDEVVIEGEMVRRGEQPWLVLIYTRPNTDSIEWSFQCTGTLITPTHVITSYQQMTDHVSAMFPAPRLLLAAGLYHRALASRGPDSQARGVVYIIGHEGFERASKVNDIALLVANHSFVLTSDVNVVCADWSSQLITPSPHDVIITSAWRRSTNNTKRFMTAIQHVRILPCVESVNPRYVTAGKICAVTINNDTCYTSYSAGLLVRHGVKYYLRGVASTGLSSTSSGGCYSDRQVAFTNVAQQVGWIQRHLQLPPA